jgi:transposase-like protein
MPSPRRDAASAKRFFRKALRASHTLHPHVIIVDRNPANPKPAGKPEKKGTLDPGFELRPVNYLNNLIEQAPRGYPRFIRWRINPGMGIWSTDTAWRTLQGYEATHQLRKGQANGTTRGHQGSNPVRVHLLRAGSLTGCLHSILARPHLDPLQLLQHYR